MFPLTVQIVDVNQVKKNLVGEIAPEQVIQEIDTLAREFGNRVKVPGFRPGKVPLNIIKQRYKSELWQEMTEEIIRRSWQAAVSEHKLEPLSEPVVETVEGEPGKALHFTLSFEILPKLEISDYKGVNVSAEKEPLGEAEVDHALQHLREQSAQFTPVENAEIRDGHYVTMTVAGDFSDSEKPIREDDVTLIIGDPATDPLFSENLRGAKVGDIRIFDATYPEDHHRKQFAGKTVHYTITIREIKEKQLTELNDDFAKDLGAESLEQLKGRIKDDLVTKASRDAEMKAKEAVISDILSRHTFEVPECLVDDELRDRARRLAAGLAQQGIDVHQTSIDWKKLFQDERPRAEQGVRRSIVLDAIAKQEGIEVTDAEIDEYLESIAKGTQKSVAAVRAQFEKDKRIQGLTELLRHNKALEFIYRNANITGGD
jgi:trigger factor